MTGTAETAVLAGKESKSNGHCVPRAAAAAATYDAMIPSELILRRKKCNNDDGGDHGRDCGESGFGRKREQDPILWLGMNIVPRAATAAAAAYGAMTHSDHSSGCCYSD